MVAMAPDRSQEPIPVKIAILDQSIAASGRPQGQAIRDTLDGKPGYKPVLRPSAPPSWRRRPLP